MKLLYTTHSSENLGYMLDVLLRKREWVVVKREGEEFQVYVRKEAKREKKNG